MKLGSVFYSPETQYENLGDALIAKNLIKMLSVNNIVYLSTSKAPSNFIKIISSESSVRVNNRMKFLLLPFLKRIKGEKVVFYFKPGHLYGDAKNLGGKHKAFIKLTYTFLLFLIGVNIRKVGVSIGPFSKFYMFYERTISKMAESYGLRDDVSLKYAKDNNFYNVKRTLDLGYFVDNNIDDKKFVKDAIAFSFREDFTESKSDKFDYIIKSLELISKKFSIKKFKSVTQVQRDLDFNNKISSKLIELGYEVDQVYYEIDAETYDKVISEYSKSMCTVSNRLHSLILGLSVGAYPIAIGDSKVNFKVKHVLDDLEGSVFLEYGSENLFENAVDNILNFELSALKKYSYL